MKKNLLFAAAVLLLGAMSFTSCKKKTMCECTYKIEIQGVSAVEQTVGPFEAEGKCEDAPEIKQVFPEGGAKFTCKEV